MQPEQPAPSSFPANPTRISDDDRERAISALREHTIAGRLSFDDLALRAAAVYKARTRGDLDVVLHDLPPVAIAAAPPPLAPDSTTPERRGAEWTIAIMSSANRRGRWRVHHETTAISIMGGCNLDLREAVLDGPELTITCFAMMGAIDILVPEGIEVEVEGIAIMGAKEARLSGIPPMPGTPLVRVRAYALMGAVNVKSRPIADRVDADDRLEAVSAELSLREEKGRRKAERHALREQARRERRARD